MKIRDCFIDYSVMPTLFVCYIAGLLTTPTQVHAATVDPAQSSQITPTTHSAVRRLCPTAVLLPAVFRDHTETVTTYEASPTYTTTPAKMDYGTQTIKVADGYTEYQVIPAKIQEITEEVEVERERVEIESIPATYRQVTKRVKIKEATQRWNPACKAFQDAIPPDTSTLPSHCLIRVPAQYRDIQTHVVEMPPRTIKKIIPAKKQRITRKVVVEPAKVVATPIAPVYETVKLTRVSQSASVITTPNSSRTEAIPTHQAIRTERVVIMPALCESDVNPQEIQQIQQKLQQQGYYRGAIDGILAEQTRQAILDYQESQQLASGALTVETLQKLGLR